MVEALAGILLNRSYPSTTECGVYGGSTHNHPKFADLCLSGLPGKLVALSGYSRQSLQDHYSCSRQCCSFPDWIDGKIAGNFFWGWAHWNSSPFCVCTHGESVPSIFSAQRDLSGTLPTSLQPWRNRCVASLLWSCMIYISQHHNSTSFSTFKQPWCKISDLYCLFWLSYPNDLQVVLQKKSLL